MINVLTVFGTRPEAIKMAPVIEELKSRPDVFRSHICVTAQHREMLDQMMGVFGISAEHDLDLMCKGQTPAEVAGKILSRLPPILDEVKPDVLLVQGDTITTFAAALVAYLNHIPVGHVEAGLRTGNLDQPFPEEMNRRLTTRLASLHFAPTESARTALINEGVPENDIFVTGNTVIDSLLATLNPDHKYSTSELLEFSGDRQLVLVTMHRRESFGKPMENICRAIATIATNYPAYQVVLPVHPNPSVMNRVTSALGQISNVTLCEPMEYRDFVNLMDRAKVILTDSGGVQEEAPSLNVPVLVLRETTERPEGVKIGAARLVGTDYDRIVQSTTELLDNERVYEKMAGAENPYGDGNAGQRIVDVLERRIENPSKRGQ